MNIYLKQKLFAIGDKYDFTDINQKIIYQAKKPALSLTKIFMNDPNGQELFLIKKKLFKFLSEYNVYKGDKLMLTVKKRFSMKPKYDIMDGEGKNYNLTGNFIGFNFQLVYEDKYIGSVNKKYFSFGDAYELSVDDDYDPALFCCIALIIDNCIHSNKNKRYR